MQKKRYHCNIIYTEKKTCKLKRWMHVATKHDRQTTQTWEQNVLRRMPQTGEKQEIAHDNKQICKKEEWKKKPPKL